MNQELDAVETLTERLSRPDRYNDQRCTLRQDAGYKGLDRRLTTTPGSFVLCEYPERPPSNGCPFNILCSHCRVVLVGMMNLDPGLVIELEGDAAFYVTGLHRRSTVTLRRVVERIAQEDPLVARALAQIQFNRISVAT